MAFDLDRLLAVSHVGDIFLESDFQTEVNDLPF
jgi:hypothetical protein